MDRTPIMVSLSYFRKYHADFDDIPAQLRAMLTTTRHDVTITTDHDQVMASWKWPDYTLTGFAANGIASVLCDHIEDAARRTATRPPDLINASVIAGPDHYTLIKSPHPYALAEREAIADQQRAEAEETTRDETNKALTEQLIQFVPNGIPGDVMRRIEDVLDALDGYESDDLITDLYLAKTPAELREACKWAANDQIRAVIAIIAQ